MRNIEMVLLNFYLKKAKLWALPKKNFMFDTLVVIWQ